MTRSSSVELRFPTLDSLVMIALPFNWVQLLLDTKATPQLRNLHIARPMMVDELTSQHFIVEREILRPHPRAVFIRRSRSNQQLTTWHTELHLLTLVDCTLLLPPIDVWGGIFPPDLALQKLTMCRCDIFHLSPGGKNVLTTLLRDLTHLDTFTFIHEAVMPGDVAMYLLDLILPENSRASTLVNLRLVIYGDIKPLPKTHWVQFVHLKVIDISFNMINMFEKCVPPTLRELRIMLPLKEVSFDIEDTWIPYWRLNAEAWNGKKLEIVKMRIVCLKLDERCVGGRGVKAVAKLREEYEKYRTDSPVWEFEVAKE